MGRARCRAAPARAGRGDAGHTRRAAVPAATPPARRAVSGLGLRSTPSAASSIMTPRRMPSERALGSKSADERRGVMQAIGASLPRIAKPVLGKQGLGEAQLLQEWPAIIGDELARYCWPIKLSFPRGERRDGTLRLRVASALALEIQHREPVLLERINGYF